MTQIVKAQVPAQALQELVYLRLKERIVNCDLLPGSVLSEDRLTSEFGTSRTPVREALLRLQRELLVDIFPRQGTFVSQISLKDIYEVFDIRLIIEPRVARAVAKHLDAAVLENFRRTFASLDLSESSFKEWFRHDRDLHSYLIEKSDNRRLVQMYSSIMDQNLRMRILAGKVPRRIADANQEHEKIVDALLSQDEERIENVMSDHILASRDAALKIEGFLHS